MFEKSGTNQIDLVTTETGSTDSPKWEGGQKIIINCAGQTQTTTVIDESREYNQLSQYWKLVHTSAEKIRFDEAGEYQLSIVPENFPVNKIGFTFREFRLNPEKQEIN